MAHKQLGLYKCTQQQKAIQDIIKAFSQNTTKLVLGDRVKLGERGSSLLIDLIKSKNLESIEFSDCSLGGNDLKQIKQLLLGKTDALVFRDHSSLGNDGTLFLQFVLKMAPVSKFTVWDCSLTPRQLEYLTRGLLDMSGDTIEELNLRGSYMGEEGCRVIAKLLERKRVRKLDVSGSYVTASQLSLIAGGLNRMKGTMDCLSLRGNLISRKEVEEFKSQTQDKVIEVLFY